MAFNPEILDRMPPNNLEAEQSVVGSVLLVPDLMDDLSWLPARDFYHEPTRLLWSAMLEIHSESGRLDETTVTTRVRELGKEQLTGGRKYINDCMDTVGSPGTAPELARVIRSHAALRRAIASSLEVVQECHATGKPNEILRRAELKLSSCVNELGASIKRKRTVTLEQACLEHLERLGKPGGALVATGLAELDFAMGGGAALGELVVVGARPSHGKTLLALQWLEAAASIGIPSLLVSEEMSIDAVGRRGLQRITPFQESQWLPEKDAIKGGVAKRFDLCAPVYIAESLGSTTAACLEIDRLCSQKGVQVVAVDYAQLLRGRGESRYEQVTNTSTDLKQCATRNNCLLILLAQLSRKIEERPGNAPVLSDLRESGQLEQDADVVLFLQWPWKINQEEPEELYRIFQAKNRNRGIRQPVTEVRIDPARQTLKDRLLGESFRPESFR